MQQTDWSPVMWMPETAPPRDEFTRRDVRAAHAGRAANGKPEMKPYAWGGRADAQRDAQVAEQVAAIRAEAERRAGLRGRTVKRW